MTNTNQADNATLRALEADRALLQAQRLREDGKIDQASALVYQIVQAMPDHVRALRMLGSLAMQTGAPDIAIGSLGQATALSPRSAELLVELGDAFVAAKRPAEAVSAYKKALTIRPNDGTAFRGLGQAQTDMGNRTDAVKSFRKALSILPYDQYSAHMIAALTGETSKAADGYVADLFDTYATLFDEHLTGTLEYRVPHLIRDIVAKHADGTVMNTALDLGCGTGLVGDALQGMVAIIDGIDISSKMTQKAAERGIYRHLKTGDAPALLAADLDFAGPYDLVTAADVFIYFGPLEASFAAIAQRLSPGGLFAFSVETTTADTVSITSSGRFGHPAAYIDSLAAAHRFKLVDRQDITVRLERNQPIPGQLHLLAKS